MNKKCPWCGGEGYLLNSLVSFGRGYKVTCGNPACTMFPTTPFCYSEKEAWERWNIRKGRKNNADKKEA